MWKSASFTSSCRSSMSFSCSYIWHLSASPTICCVLSVEAGDGWRLGVLAANPRSRQDERDQGGADDERASQRQQHDPYEGGGIRVPRAITFDAVRAAKERLRRFA